MKTTDLTDLQQLTPGQQQQVQAAQAAQHAARAATRPGVPCATLGCSGDQMPLVGLGTWKSEPGAVGAAVRTAVAAGYRHIDCAAVYGNEPEVGAALRQVFAEGQVSRDQLWVTSKLWNSDHGRDRAAAALRRTLKDLQPGATVQPPLSETWAALEDLRAQGLVRHLGVSNFSAPKLEALMAGARVMPAVLQVEAHPFWRNQALLDWAASRGIHVTAYSPLGSPDSADMMGRSRDAPRLLQDPVVARLARAHARSPAQVLIRWGLQRGTSVLPKSTRPERIAANLEVCGWELTPQDMQALSSLEFQQRMVPGSFLVHPAGPYKSVQELWDEGWQDPKAAPSPAQRP